MEIVRITTPSGEWLELQKRGPLSTFIQVATLVGLHAVRRVQGAQLTGPHACAQGELVRTGLDSWTLRSKGSEGYEGDIATGLRLHDALMRLNRYENRIWADHGPDGARVFNHVAEAEAKGARSLTQMAWRTGLVLE